MDLNRLIIDLEEIKSAISEDPERAEDLLGFVISEIGIAAQQSVPRTCANCGKNYALTDFILGNGKHICGNCGASR